MKKRGFTLIEMMVVLTVISVLTGIVTFEILDGVRQSRDAERVADIHALQTAIELYKQRNGEYPEACNGPNAWSGQIDGDYKCSGTDPKYIVGLEPYLPVLPMDPELNGNSSGYMYVTNGDRSAYKVKANGTLETNVQDGGGCGEAANTFVLWGGFDSSGNSGCDLN